MQSVLALQELLWALLLCSSPHLSLCDCKHFRNVQKFSRDYLNHYLDHLKHFLGLSKQIPSSPYLCQTLVSQFYEIFITQSWPSTIPITQQLFSPLKQLTFSKLPNFVSYTTPTLIFVPFNLFN